MSTSNKNFNRLRSLSIEQQEIATPLLLHLHGLRRIAQSSTPFEIIPVGDVDTAILSGHEVYYHGSRLNPTQYNEKTLLELSLAISGVLETGTPIYDYFQNLYSDTPSKRFLKTAKQIADLGPEAWR